MKFYIKLYPALESKDLFDDLVFYKEKPMLPFSYMKGLEA